MGKCTVTECVWAWQRKEIRENLEKALDFISKKMNRKHYFDLFEEKHGKLARIELENLLKHREKKERPHAGA